MPVQIIGDVEKNILDVSPEYLEQGGGVIHFRGAGSRVTIGKPAHAGTIYCTITDNASISLGHDYVFYNLSVHALASGAEISVGDKFAFNGNTMIFAHEASKLRIGDGCLFGGECNIATSDVHRIYDAQTNVRINPPADIVIGDRVWMADHVRVMKGVAIGHDSVVGAGSVVTTSFEPASLIAGVPARLIRSGIRWEY